MLALNSKIGAPPPFKIKLQIFILFQEQLVSSPASGLLGRYIASSKLTDMVAKKIMKLLDCTLSPAYCFNFSSKICLIPFYYKFRFEVGDLGRDDSSNSSVKTV